MACDAVLIPCDSSLNVNRVWTSILPENLEAGDGHWLRLPGGIDDNGVVPLGDHDGRRIRAFVAVDGDDTPGTVVGRVWKAIGHVMSDLEPGGGRASPLIGIPLPGTGDGGLKGRRGEVIDRLLQHHRDNQYSCDIALVLWDRRDFAAAQIRRNSSSDWPELDDEQRVAADRLGGLARAGQLSLFLGAGVSRPAGLPDWNSLLQQLAAEAGVSDLIEGLAPEDAAGTIREALGDRYHQLLCDLLDARRHAVGHALLASLRVHQMVTTNFDPCLELALDAVLESGYSVLARQLTHDNQPWLLKLNGDVRAPESIVLTRAEFERHTVESQALRGVVQALLLTSHLLFVGYSLREESFLALAQEVTRVRQQARSTDMRPTGTAVAVTSGDAAHFGYSELHSVAMDETSPADGARRLEIFLDRLCWKAASSDDWAAQYLLDDEYASGLRDNERALKYALQQFMNAVGPEAKTSPGWSRIAGVLRALGAEL